MIKPPIYQMKNPGFYCIDFIETHNNLPKYQKPQCKNQCDKCVNEIIDHHNNKKLKK